MQRFVHVALFAAAAAVSAFSITRGIDPFDEGLALQAASRVADGQLPYRDFQWAYGPGQPFTLAALWETFGPSLLVWRVLRVLVNAAVAVAVFALARRAAPPWLATVAALTAACAMAQPLSANPFPLALLFSLVALGFALSQRSGGAAQRAGWAGAFVGLAAVWRLDFGIYAGIAVAVALRRSTPRAAGVAAAVAGVAYLPFVVLVGPADIWDALVANSLRDSEHWTLPFPLEYEGHLSSARELKDALDFYVPLLLAIGLVTGAIAAIVRWAREREIAWDWLTLGAFAAGGWLYLRSRTDEFHATPLLVTLAVLLAWLIARRTDPGAGTGTGRAQRALTIAAATVLALLLAASLGNRLSALTDPPELEPLRLAIADGVNARPVDAAALPSTVALVKRLVPPGEPIYVVTQRSDLVRIGNPLLYVLTDRPNALREDFDLLTSASEQADLVRRLSADPPRAIIRWTDPQSSAREPNKRGQPSGSRTLDDYLARAYRLRARNGYYDVLVPG